MCRSPYTRRPAVQLTRCDRPPGRDRRYPYKLAVAMRTAARVTAPGGPSPPVWFLGIRTQTRAVGRRRRGSSWCASVVSSVLVVEVGKVGSVAVVVVSHLLTSAV